MDQFDKADNKNIFRLAILGNSTKAHRMAANFESNLLNAVLFESIDDLVMWDPNTIMVVDCDDLETTLHRLYQETRVAINVFTTIPNEPERLNQLVDDYRGLDSFNRTTMCLRDGVWGGTEGSMANTMTLYRIFARELPTASEEGIMLPEAILLDSLLSVFSDYSEESDWLEFVRSKAKQWQMPFTRIERLATTALTLKND